MFSCSFPFLSCSFWLLCCLLHATAEVHICQTESLAVQWSVDVAATGSVSEGPLGVAGKDDCAVYRRSEEISFVSVLLKCCIHL